MYMHLKTIHSLNVDFSSILTKPLANDLNLDIVLGVIYIIVSSVTKFDTQLLLMTFEIDLIKLLDYIRFILR